jgi:cell division septation protein DedD
MGAERRGADTTRELRLEGVGLLLGVAVLLALLGGAFYLGRWVERRVPGRPPAERGIESALAAEPQPDADAAAGLTRFDGVGGEATEFEPAREAAARRPATESGSAAAAARPPTPGSFFVQVSALRDEAAAGALVRELEGRGFAVRLVAEREGQGSLFKVRVGGFESEPQARDAAERLKRAGYAGAFLTTADRD